MASVRTPDWLLNNSIISCNAFRFTSFHLRSLNGSEKSNRTQHWRNFWINNSSRSAAVVSVKWKEKIENFFLVLASSNALVWLEFLKKNEKKIARMCTQIIHKSRTHQKCKKCWVEILQRTYSVWWVHLADILVVSISQAVSKKSIRNISELEAYTTIVNEMGNGLKGVHWKMEGDSLIIAQPKFGKK